VTDSRKSNISLPERERGGSLRGGTKYISIILISKKLGNTFRKGQSENKIDSC
jgi:hypothetical protein